MTSVLDLVQQAIERIGDHDIRYNCDTIEMAEALGALAQARDMLRAAYPPREEVE